MQKSVKSLRDVRTINIYCLRYVGQSKIIHIYYMYWTINVKSLNIIQYIICLQILKCLGYFQKNAIVSHFTLLKVPHFCQRMHF